jgi:magnesium-transporting ATPase (P-type)
MSWSAIRELVRSLSQEPPRSPAASHVVLSSTRGRLRIHLGPDLRAGHTALEDELLRLRAVSRLDFDPLTGNLLVLFDPATPAEAILACFPAPPPEPSPPAPAPPAELEVVAASRGRLRVHLPRRMRPHWAWLDEELRRTSGVLRVEYSYRTANLLILYDHGTITAEDLRQRLRDLRANPPQPGQAPQRNGKATTARVAFRGLDRNPRLARQVINLLHKAHGVRARARTLTGHLLVEYDHHRVLLEDILATIAHLELPELPEEDAPEHPLDPEPLAHGSVKAAGALLGMAVLTLRRLFAGGALAVNAFGIAATTAGIVNIAQGFPLVRDGLRKLLGHTAADAVANAVGLVALTVADAPMGMIVVGVETLIFLGEVTARRASWTRYEEQLDGSACAEPGAVIRLEAGMRVPHAGRVVEGFGTATGRGGLPTPLVPGALVPAGAVLAGGPFVLDLHGGDPFEPGPRPAPPRPTFYHRYVETITPLSLAYAAFNGLRTLSPIGAFEGLLLLNPRTAAIGMESANLGAASRALRGGLTVIGTRPHRPVALPDVLLLDGPRLLTDGLEIAAVVPVGENRIDDLVTIAAGLDSAAGSPWGSAFPQQDWFLASEGSFNGLWATAVVGGVHCTLGPPEDEPLVSEDFLRAHQGGYLLELRVVDIDQPLGYIALQPRISRSAADLFARCRALGVRVELLPAGSPLSARIIADRAGVGLADSREALHVIRREQEKGDLVYFVSDHADAAEAFAACDLAIGMAHGRGEFPVRADVLAPDLAAVGDLLDAGACRKAAVNDAVVLSMLANGIGAVLGLRGHLGLEMASMTVYLAALGAMGAGAVRLRGGERRGSALAYLSDPRPERWGRRGIDEVLRNFASSEEGLTSAAAAARRVAPHTSTRDDLLIALRNQVRAPITGILAGGAALTLVLAQPLNTTILGVTISLNVAAGVWQERQIGMAAEALQRLGAATARVLRDGVAAVVPASDVVPGDVLVLAAGDRVAADARLISASSLEVAEAALTGESLPVPKAPADVPDHNRIVLEGSDVIVGSGRAVVVAVGRQTRLGATAAALNVDRDEESPLGARLGRILRIALPVAAGGGALAGLAGLAYGGAPVAMVTLAVTTALSAIPEGLPLLAGVGQAAVARRLARRQALVRRVAAIEALGRVDVACTDKTGTLTEGRLALRMLADAEVESPWPGPLSPEMRRLLLVAALASPHPDSADAALHPTDAAVMRAAVQADLHDEMRAPREAEVPFDSARAFRASVVGGRVCVKGAPERIIARCKHVRRGGADRPLDDPGREELLAAGVRLAARGLRVLLVAEGPADGPPDDPAGLTALGFVGITDPLRHTVPPAVHRCLAAGIRVIMLTGDHPATARAIAQEAGLLVPGHDTVLKAADLADLPADELDRRLDGVAVIARATPLDKLRIVESLRRRNHTVAMTGDGVNDAPSLRLADVGVAMGMTGTEVARQASDVVLVDDDFASLVEALVEGRGFWRNMRTGLGLLLGGNIGELGLIVGANLLGYGSPLVPAQILIVNLITDTLPSLAVLLQRPQHRDLAALAREGLSALDHGLRRDVARRALATAIPSLASFMWSHATAGPVQGSAVAFTGVVATQLAQTLEAGRVEGTLSESVVAAVSTSVALLVSSVTIPPVRTFLNLQAPTLTSWGVVGAAAAGAVGVSRLFNLAWRMPPAPSLLPEA